MVGAGRGVAGDLPHEECPVTLMDTCKKERSRWGAVLCNGLRLLVLALPLAFVVLGFERLGKD